MSTDNFFSFSSTSSLNLIGSSGFQILQLLCCLVHDLLLLFNRLVEITCNRFIPYSAVSANSLSDTRNWATILVYNKLDAEIWIMEKHTLNGPCPSMHCLHARVRWDVPLVCVSQKWNVLYHCTHLPALNKNCLQDPIVLVALPGDVLVWFEPRKVLLIHIYQLLRDLTQCESPLLQLHCTVSLRSFSLRRVLTVSPGMS